MIGIASPSVEGSFEIGGIADLAFVLLVLGAIASVVLWLARPWELKGLSFADQVRIGEAVSSYDFWLGWRGVSGRQRRALRAELRGNLWEAAQRVGAGQAIEAVGPLRTLAQESVPERRGPQWGLAVAACLVAIEVTVMAQLFVVAVVADAAQAAGVARLDVPITLLPGMTAHYAHQGTGFTMAADLGPVSLIVGAVVFVIVARPWRLLRRARSVSGG